MDRDVAEELFAACGKALAALTEAEHAIRRIANDDERKELMRALSSPIVDVISRVRAPVIRQYPELEPPEVLGSPDTDLSDEEQEAVSGLRPSDVELIDRTLLSECAAAWRKVARVVGTTMSALQELPVDVPDSYYAQRIALLVASGKLESQGNLEYMRFSEVRLAGGQSAA
jgi:DNA-binding transcriptional LysR family regulator